MYSLQLKEYDCKYSTSSHNCASIKRKTVFTLAECVPYFTDHN